METTFNDAIARYNIISNVLISEGSKELQRDTKIKVVKNRINLNKAKTEWDNVISQIAENLSTEEYVSLAQNKNRTNEEENRFRELDAKINDEFLEIINEKANDKIDINVIYFTEEEFNDIIDLNASHDVVINDNKINSAAFLEMFYNMFC